MAITDIKRPSISAFTTQGSADTLTFSLDDDNDLMIYTGGEYFYIDRRDLKEFADLITEMVSDSE